MKYLLLLLLISFSVFAQKDPIEDQIAITSDVIDQFIYRIQNSNNGSVLKLDDYYEWKKTYDARIEKALIEYETTLKNRVFGPLIEINNRYRSVSESQSIRNDQKDVLLQSIISQIESLKPSIELEYKKALVKLYYSHEMLPNRFIKSNVEVLYFNSKDKQVNRERTNGYRKYKFDMNVVFPDKNNTTLTFNSTTYPSNLFLNIYDKYSSKLMLSTFENDSNDWHFKTKECKRGSWAARDCYKEYLKVTEAVQVPQAYYLRTLPYKITHHKFLQDCKTQICVLMKSSDISYFNASFSSIIAKDIILFLNSPFSKYSKEFLNEYQFDCMHSEYWKKNGGVEKCLDFLAKKLGHTKEGDYKLTIKAPKFEATNEFIQEVLKRTDYSEEYEQLPYSL